MATPLAARTKRVTFKTIPVYLALILLIFFARPTLSLFVPGLIFVLIGEALRVWAAGHLKKTKEVTTTGPYAYVKNPLYLGTLLILIGFCLMAQNMYLLIIGLAIFFVYYAPFKKKREGDRLREHFGRAWVDYDRAVPDYLPSLHPYPGRGSGRWEAKWFYENSEDGTALAVAVGILAIGLRFWFGAGQ
ncbi:MAG TPA: isoprenylcysteine carboxylmethyltransferase family protein [Nitrospiria bacterium]|nr:isoprenylcysteine carboxylmethyltransferase family protein [Nitrospiria bacterium]